MAATPSAERSSTTRNSTSTDVATGIVFQAAVYGDTSWAEEARAAALGLAQCGIPIQLVPVELQEDSRRLLPALVRKGLERLTRQSVELASSVLYHGEDPDLWNLDFYGRCRVGRAGFWTDRIPDGWCERCNAVDEVWVPSEFNREALAASGVKPDKLRVLHAGVDTQLFQPGLQPLNIPHRRGFNFLSISDLQLRRGTGTLLKAYLQEFKPDEDVSLTLKISRRRNRLTDPAAELAFLIEREAGVSLEHSPPVILLGAPLSRMEMSRLYSSADAFVLSFHGEAHGQAFLEGLASALPVVATRWGGPLDFLDDENSYLVEVNGLAPAAVEDERAAGHLWAEPSVDHVRQILREIHSSPEEARKRGQRGRQDMVRNRDWSVVAPQWANEFRRLLQ